MIGFELFYSLVLGAMFTHQLNLNLKQEEEALKRLFSYGEVKVVPAKTLIFRSGNSNTHMYFFQKGRANAVMSKDGKEYIVGSLVSKDFVGEVGLFISGHTHISDLRTVEPTTYHQIPLAKVVELLKGPLASDATTLLTLFGNRLAHRWIYLAHQASSLALLDTPSRIWLSLLDLTKHSESMTHPKGIQVKVSRQDLSRQVGCSREMAGRIIKDFVKEGRMEARGKTMVVFEEYLNPLKSGSSSLCS